MERIRFAALSLWLVIVPVAAGHAFSQSPGEARAKAAETVRAEKYLRTELYFGRSRLNGSLVADEEWNSFLKGVVTPRFPDGFTCLKGFGQYRDRTGRIITEPSEVIIFLYPERLKKESRVRIEEIRAAYIKQFEQESVLRVDLPKAVRVSF